MATTYTLISSVTVGSGGATTVTFSSIPSTYTDLVVRGSARANTSSNIRDFQIQFNGDTSANYSYTELLGSGSTASSLRAPNQAYIVGGSVEGNGFTASTFTNLEVYIPSYTVAQNKPISSFVVTENNATASYIATSAGLWRSTAAINQIDFTLAAAADFAQYSTFYLYGVKNL